MLFRAPICGPLGSSKHLLVTDGGFRPDGTFVSWPAHDTARLTEAFRRAVLRLFVRLDLFDEDQAAGMLTWPQRISALLALIDRPMLASCATK